MNRILITLTAMTITVGCNQSTTTEKTTETVDSTNSIEQAETTEKPTLKSILDARKANFNEKATDDKKRVYAQGIDAVQNSGIIESAKQVGDKAPDFSLTDALGNEVKLSDRLKNGPVILTWYRGGWCPYCNITLHRLQEELPSIKNAGAELIALTPELPDSSMSTAEKNELEFQVLSDVGSSVARNYGVLFTLTDEVAAMYNASFGLDNYNGDDKHELPLAATYVIDRSGIIQYAFLDADYRNRAEPTDILSALNALTH